MEKEALIQFEETQMREDMNSQKWLKNAEEMEINGISGWLTDVKAGFAGWLQEKRTQMVTWWLSECGLYSALVGEKVTWRCVARIHAVIIAMVVMVLAWRSDMVVTGASMASTAFLVYRLTGRRENKLNQAKKGGRR